MSGDKWTWSSSKSSNDARRQKNASPDGPPSNKQFMIDRLMAAKLAQITGAVHPTERLIVEYLAREFDRHYERGSQSIERQMACRRQSGAKTTARRRRPRSR